VVDGLVGNIGEVDWADSQSAEPIDPDDR